jgi:hypothetical protein
MAPRAGWLQIAAGYYTYMHTSTHVYVSTGEKCVHISLSTYYMCMHTHIHTKQNMHICVNIHTHHATPGIKIHGARSETPGYKSLLDSVHAHLHVSDDLLPTQPAAVRRASLTS